MKTLTVNKRNGGEVWPDTRRRFAEGGMLCSSVGVLYRLSVAAIVGFWLLMTGLLVRAVWFRDASQPEPVPLSYVSHLVFRHEVASDLVLYRQHHRADGHFHFQPKRLPAGSDQAEAANLLSASGNFLLGVPGDRSQRVVFHAAVELDAREQVRRLDLSISFHESKGAVPGIAIRIDGRPAENQWHYQLTQAGTVLREGSGTPEELLGSIDPHFLGVDPRVLTRATTGQTNATVTAQRGHLRVSADDLETYVVTIRQGEGPEMTIHVNQVGQVVAVKTFLGIDLYEETLEP